MLIKVKKGKDSSFRKFVGAELCDKLPSSMTESLMKTEQRAIKKYDE